MGVLSYSNWSYEKNKIEKTLKTNFNTLFLWKTSLSYNLVEKYYKQNRFHKISQLMKCSQLRPWGMGS